MVPSSNSTSPILSNQYSPTTIKICLYLKETPESQSISTLIELSRVPMMGEFIEIEGNLYRVFVVCHQANFQGVHAAVAAVKTPWHSCESLIQTQDSVES